MFGVCLVLMFVGVVAVVKFVSACLFVCLLLLQSGLFIGVDVVVVVCLFCFVCLFVCLFVWCCCCWWW